MRPLSPDVSAIVRAKERFREASVWKCDIRDCPGTAHTASR